MKEVNQFGAAVELLLKPNPEARVKCHGRAHGRADALLSLGYDGASKRGFLAEYKREILGFE